MTFRHKRILIVVLEGVVPMIAQHDGRNVVPGDLWYSSVKASIGAAWKRLQSLVCLGCLVGVFCCTAVVKSLVPSSLKRDIWGLGIEESDGAGVDTFALWRRYTKYDRNVQLEVLDSSSVWCSGVVHSIPTNEPWDLTINYFFAE